MQRGTKIALGAGAAGLLALMLMQSRQPTIPGAGFIIGGKRYPSQARVQTWDETGMGFSGLADRKSTRGVVLHFSGSAAATPKSIYNTLVQRKLNVQLALGRDGTFVQFCDLNKRCSHATYANATYLGIEIAGDGKSYTPAQMQGLFQGLTTILGAYKLPWRVPTRDDQVVTGVLSTAEFNAFTGILGHYMIEGDKQDPGVPLMTAVATRNLSIA